ncbi:zinc-dependent alcohol dehydrogenase [Aspergillus saccharolyticus JOP 1030-1]|uniref:alcohol dehydrogenase n=1 Tax=Aspergillus saccharolyticus JOP 1030-1 TaxID=1450539 RepID=A0A318Z7D5_9EURO|nr:GroES-like protein [Aspergillus saccharolyticus JOP 1030-1]PYH42334.1 GroES-like protein [Aspergillus saccharolyticus JOP 1030-1]
MITRTSPIPKQQRAVVRSGSGSTATTTIQTIDVDLPGPGQILVRITWTGLCGSDKALLHDEWAGFGVAMTPQAKGVAGHEGVGVVVAVGEGMENRWNIGDRAGIKWIAKTCGECEFCLSGVDEVNCIRQVNSGFTAPGTFQEYCVADGRYTSKIPDGVSDEDAGPIMCGGVTAYVACKRANVKAGQWIVLPGAGGGLGHLAIQYARAMGMRVIAIDGGDDKRELCQKLGAEVFIDYLSTPDIAAEVRKITTHGAHGVIVTAATKTVYATAPTYLRPNGTLVAVGLPADPSILAGAPPMLLSLKRLNVVGTVTGTLKDVEEALDFTARKIVHPVLVKGKLEDLNSWVEKLEKGQLAGRAVLQVAKI